MLSNYTDQDQHVTIKPNCHIKKQSTIIDQQLIKGSYMRTMPPTMHRAPDIRHVTKPEISAAETTSKITEINNTQNNI